jgi:acylphosphatase
MDGAVNEHVGVHVVVRGTVQGVWFRESCRRYASRLALAGWVKNLADGTVEAVFEGRRDAVELAVEWCRRGPSRAVVTSIEARPQALTGLIGFEVR